jgi:hypothetical protein
MNDDAIVSKKYKLFDQASNPEQAHPSQERVAQPAPKQLSGKEEARGRYRDKDVDQA